MFKFLMRTSRALPKTVPALKKADPPPSGIAPESFAARTRRLDTDGRRRRKQQAHEDNRLL